ncbi:MAG: polysaccharide pyruvyl transferase family protein [Lachnospiraceae bacterium]|nr:polysaccharide pyruvyl transferase family protein [Lachnospiraceae bacterium]
MSKKQVNVLLVEIVNRNLGDCVIAETAEYLVKRAIKSNDKIKYFVCEYNIYSKDMALVRYSDVIVFAGGGLVKYKQEKFYEYVSEIIEVAEQEQIPVYFNGVGVEHYDEDDERCQMLKNALNKNCVKEFVVRDDVETLKNDYIENPNIKIVKAIDPVVSCSKIYQIKRQSKSKVIGLGIIRSEIFEDYGISGIDKQQQLDFWKNITKLVEKAGYQWQLFTNGLNADAEFAKEVLAYCGKDKEQELYLAEQATSARQLVRQISRYCGIIAGRMHSNIIAYGLEIPSIPIVWNDKIKYWGESIRYEERLLLPEEFQADIAMEKLVTSLKQGVRKRIFVKVAEKRISTHLNKFLKSYSNNICSNENAEKKIAWKKRLVATGIGGIEKKFSNLNYVPNMDVMYNEGFRKFEADIRLTRDNHLVCINGWSEKNFEKMGVSSSQWEEGIPDFEEFKKLAYYGCYGTFDINELIEKFETYGDTVLILDLGRPTKEKAQICLEQLDAIFSKKQELLQRVVIRLQSKFDVKLFVDSELEYRIAYYIPKESDRIEKGITVENVAAFCKKNKIRIVTMAKETFNGEIAEQLHESGIKVCVFSYNTYQDIRIAMDQGADMVGTQFMNVNKIQGMLEKR